MEALDKVEDPRSPKYWTECDQYVAHVQALQRHAKRYQVESTHLFDMSITIGSYLGAYGRFEEAEAMNRRALKGREKVLGVEHRDTLASVNNLALAFQQQGKYEEAEAMHRRALEGREKVLGVEHPETLTSIYGLAYMLHQQQKYVLAKSMYERALAGFGKVLRPDHPTTKACFDHCSSLLQDMEEKGIRA